MPNLDKLNLSSIIKEIKELFSFKGKVPTNTKSTDLKPSGFQVPIKSSFANSGGFDQTGKGSVGRVHLGLDLRASGGTSIFPIATGVVTAVRSDPKGGNTVNIKHANNITSYYAHMGTISVHPNDHVDMNTVLGTVGDSGNAKGFPHLHLQIWQNGTLIDPATIISVPPYTAFNSQKEKLWQTNAKAQAYNWNLQEHLNSRHTTTAKKEIKDILLVADEFYSKTLKG